MAGGNVYLVMRKEKITNPENFVNPRNGVVLKIRELF
jgi:hypothetical protein